MKKKLKKLHKKLQNISHYRFKKPCDFVKSFTHRLVGACNSPKFSQHF